LFQGPLGDLGQGLLQLPPCPFVADGLQGPRRRFGAQDALDRPSLKGLIPQGVFDRPVDILTLVMLFHPQDGSGLKATVSWMSLG
jgi:hypothetical protein